MLYKVIQGPPPKVLLSLLNEYLFLLCLAKCSMCAQVCAGARESLWCGDGVGDGATGSCKLPGVGARDRTLVL